MNPKDIMVKFAKRNCEFHHQGDIQLTERIIDTVVNNEGVPRNYIAEKEGCFKKTFQNTHMKNRSKMSTRDFGIPKQGKSKESMQRKLLSSSLPLSRGAHVISNEIRRTKNQCHQSKLGRETSKFRISKRTRGELSF